MYLFQSRHRNNNVQLPSKKVIRFTDFYFGTENSALGEELDSISGKEFWRIDNLKVTVKPEVPVEAKAAEAAPPVEEVKAKPEEEPKVEALQPPPKRRGRPRIVQGMRMSEEKGEEQ